jgi:hypothetical protein
MAYKRRKLKIDLRIDNYKLMTFGLYSYFLIALGVLIYNA